MVKHRHGFRNVSSFGLIVSIGTIFAIGCSDDASEPAAGSAGSGSVTPAASATLPSNPSLPTSPDSPAPSPSPVAEEPVALSAEELIAGGRSVYNANCIACHSMDPTKDGALGPAVSGSPLELLETRVLRGEYPDGYTPKRPTRVMIPLPHLKPRLAELAAYLNTLD